MHRVAQTHPYIDSESVQMKNVLQENENLAKRKTEGSSMRLTNALNKQAMRVIIENILFCIYIYFYLLVFFSILAY